MKYKSRAEEMLKVIGLFAAVLSLAGQAFAQVELNHDEDNGRVEVHIRGEHFTTYHYGEDVRTPYLWPVVGEGGVAVTRNHPMGEDSPSSSDHPHHRSLWVTYGAVNGYDFWHNERIETASVETGVGEGYGWIRARNNWVNPDGETLLKEVQELRFHDHASAGHRFIDYTVTFEAAQGDVIFGDDKEGLLGFRIHTEIQGNRAGALTNARGERGERAVYGSPVRWMNYAGTIEGYGPRGIAVFDHPGNFREGYWHVRDYGLVAVNPFGRREVGGLEDGSHTLAEGESLTLRYGVFVHSGADAAQLDELHRQWSE